MITAQELRIGNFFEGKRNIIEEVTSIYLGETDGNFILKSKSGLLCGLGFAEPIPLSEQWMLKFGFEEYQGYYYPKGNSFSYFKIYKNEDGTFSLHLKDGKKLIPFVHQLQNLYFALTGEELTIQKERVADETDYGSNRLANIPHSPNQQSKNIS